MVNDSDARAVSLLATGGYNGSIVVTPDDEQEGVAFHSLGTCLYTVNQHGDVLQPMRIM